MRGNILFLVFILGCTLQTALCQQDCTECSWNPWNRWSACSKTCGEGTRTRTRGLCCRMDDNFDSCVKRCNVTDESFESDTCGFVCPAGNCSFQNVPDTGIGATDYTQLTDKDPNVVINPPIHLITGLDFCRESCLKANLQNGLFCWSYTYNDVDKCYLHFYKSPLSIVHPELQGASPGENIFIRSCTDRVACTASQAEIVFIVDSSGSIGTANFDMIKVFLQGLVNGLDIDPDLTRVGLMLYNDAPKWQFMLDTYNNKMAIQKAIQRLQYVVGGTMTADALEKTRLEGFLNNRTGVPMIAVVITDGLSRFPSLTRIQAALLRRAGVQVYSIGIGASANGGELFDLASSPEENYMYNFSSFDDLDAAMVKLQTNSVMCKDKVTTEGTTPSSTTVSQCFDTEADCAQFGEDVCTDYAPWARAHCALFCGFCNATQTEEPCVDGIPNCDQYGQYYCQNKQFVSWVNKNCKKYCGRCANEVNSTTPTTTVATTTATKICQDTINDCDTYITSCDKPEFQGFLSARCAASCGFCQSHKIIPATAVNGTSCPEWNIPVECEMVIQAPGCCPMPECPNVYVYTADMGRE